MSSNISISSLCIGAGAAAAVVVSVYESNSRSNIGGFLSSLWTGAKEEQKTALEDSSLERQFRVEKDGELLTPTKFKSILQTPHSDSSSAITEASNSSYTSTVVLEDFVTAEFEEALECLKVIRQSGSNEGLEYKFGEIKHAFHSYIKVFPRNDEALLALADLHYEMGEFSLAIDYYKSHLDVLESDNFLYVWDKLGECLTYLDNFREAKEYFESCIEYDSDPIDERYVFTVKVPTSGEASKPLQIAAQEHRPDSAADEVVESRELDRASETVPSSAVDEVSQQGGIVDGLVMCAAQDALKRFGLTPAAGFTEEGRARFISPTGEHFELSSLAGCDLEMLGSKEGGLKGGVLSCSKDSFKKVSDLTLWRESLSDHSRLGIVWECVKHPLLCISALTSSETHEAYTGPIPRMNVTQEDLPFLRAPGISAGSVNMGARVGMLSS